MQIMKFFISSMALIICCFSGESVLAKTVPTKKQSSAKSSVPAKRSPGSSSGTVGNCHFTRWPYSKSAQNIKELNIKNLDQVPRDYLYIYLYFELTQTKENRVPGLAQKLFFYLKNSEGNENRQKLITAIEFASDVDSAKPNVIPAAEICELENKLQNLKN